MLTIVLERCVTSFARNQCSLQYDCFPACVNRSIHRRCSIKKAFLKILRSIHRKTPALESLFNKAAGLLTCNLIKKRLQHRCFPVNIAKFLKTPILKNICEGLLLCEMKIISKCNYCHALFPLRYEKIIEEQASKIKELTEKQEQQRHVSKTFIDFFSKNL